MAYPRYHINPDYLKMPKAIKIGSITTSVTEIKHLLIAWVAISIAFANVLRRGGGIAETLQATSGTQVFLYALILSAVTVGIGFLLHELGHKIVSQKYGINAEFRASMNMLLIAILLSFSGFVFAAPGAVFILGRPTKGVNGIISMAGPLTNIVIAIVFLMISVVAVTPFLALITMYGFMINVWLALFNLIPVWNLDGKKVLRWNRGVYFTMLFVSIFLFFFRI